MLLCSLFQSADGTPRMEYRKVSIVPGLYKIFDEILVNAADNKQRDEKGVVMTRLDVVIDEAAGSIQVKNDGKGISVARHEKEKMHIPQLIFGELLTSSNYDDNIKQTVGGRNGFGAKLANIFSRKFVVEIEDAILGKKYTQVWRDNMGKVEAPEIKAYSGSKNSTRSVGPCDTEKIEKTRGDIKVAQAPTCHSCTLSLFSSAASPSSPSFVASACPLSTPI
jgi:DNA gyrase/topoisomerase IV subunit B